VQRYQQDPGLLFDKAAFLRTVSKSIFSGINVHIPIAVGGPKFHTGDTATSDVMLFTLTLYHNLLFHEKQHLDKFPKTATSACCEMRRSGTDHTPHAFGMSHSNSG